MQKLSLIGSTSFGFAQNIIRDSGNVYDKCHKKPPSESLHLAHNGKKKKTPLCHVLGKVL